MKELIEKAPADKWKRGEFYIATKDDDGKVQAQLVKGQYRRFGARVYGITNGPDGKDGYSGIDLETGLMYHALKTAKDIKAYTEENAIYLESIYDALQPNEVIAVFKLKAGLL